MSLQTYELQEFNKRLVALDLDPELRRVILDTAIDCMAPERRQDDLRRLAEEFTSQTELF